MTPEPPSICPKGVRHSALMNLTYMRPLRAWEGANQAAGMPLPIVLVDVLPGWVSKVVDPYKGLVAAKDTW